MELILSCEVGIKCGVVHYLMDSTNRSLANARSSEEKSWVKTKSSRGISARACAAKTMTWELELAKGVTTHDASSLEASLSQAMGGTKKTTK